MSAIRLRFTVEYEGKDEWNIGTTPGADKGESPKNHEIVTALRDIADQLEKGWPGGGNGPTISYPIFGGSA